MKHASLVPLGLLWGVWSLVAQDTPLIRLNTLGYLPHAPKQAAIAAAGTTFTVVRATGGTKVHEGTVTGPVTNADTQEALYGADFSGLADDGEFRLVVPGVGESAPFRIGRDVYRDAFRTVTRGMYLWRCGTAVRGEHAGRVFAHGPCHTNDAWLDVATGQHERQDGTGGWHDAGDYNKYVVNAGVTVGAMFRAWEDFGPLIRRVALDLPEAGGPLPEFLAELKWETDWLLKMQGPDGAVYHKLSTKNFGPFILPDQETTERFYTPISSAATADFVAMLAMGARHFRPYDAAYADRCLAAAKQGHTWLKAHPDMVRADLREFRTGAYATRDDDDRLWAAVELWETTGDEELLREVESRLRASNLRVDRDFDWGSVANLGVFTYLASAHAGKDSELVIQLRENLVAAADDIVKARNEHGYGRPLGTRYYWGCNGSVARQSLVLHAAWRASPKPVYREVALDALDHLFGRNPYGRSYVTGLGWRPPLHPHDRRSGGDDVVEPWPGYLIGGPHPKATDWKDEEEDYRTNEIAVNWNAALIYALAAFLDTPEAAIEIAAAAAKTPDVIFVPTPQRVVDRMLELAEIKPGDVLYDLGCGDGRIVVTAAKRYGIRAVGFDIDPTRVRESLDNVRSNKVEHLVTIRQQDIFTLDLREASVVTLYLLPQLNVRLMPQLARLRPGARLVSHDFDMSGAKPLVVENLKLDSTNSPEDDYIANDHTIYKWTVPWVPEESRGDGP